jgi:hypothetical protein
MFARRKEFREHKIATDASLKALTDRLEFYNRGSNEFYRSSLNQNKECLAESQKTREIFVDVVMTLLNDPYIARRVFERSRSVKEKEE